MPAEPASATAPSNLTDPKAARAARMIPFIVGCVPFMLLDSTVVATTLPAMAAALGSTPVRLNVAITSYLLAVFVPVSGWAADRFGARRIFISTIALFALSLGSLCAVAGPGATGGRPCGAGHGRAMMVPVGQVILLCTVPKRDLLKAMSFLSIPALLGPVIGPPLGGFMSLYVMALDLPDNVPIGIYLVLHFVEEVRRHWLHPERRVPGCPGQRLRGAQAPPASTRR